MSWREHLHQRIAVFDLRPVVFGAVAAILGTTMILRGLLLVYGNLMDYDVKVVQLAVLSMWSLPYWVSALVLCVVGTLSILEGFEYFPEWHVAYMIRTIVIATFWSYTAPAVWNSFVNSETTPFIVGALSTHIPIGLPYTVLAFVSRSRVLNQKDDTTQEADAQLD